MKNFFERRPWGWMVKFIHTKKFWLKYLHVRGQTSLQTHSKRGEWHLGLYHVRPGEEHRLRRGVFFELAHGEPDEADIVRIKDDYAERRKIVCTSGYFDPLHIGHLRLLEDAKKLGDWLVVIVNNDKQAEIKKGKPFMPAEERKKIIESLKIVDEVVISIDEDHTVRETLRTVKPHIFAKGGDSIPENVPELVICEELGIEAVFDIGGGKIQSSSWLIKKVK